MDQFSFSEGHELPLIAGDEPPTYLELRPETDEIPNVLARKYPLTAEEITKLRAELVSILHAEFRKLPNINAHESWPKAAVMKFQRLVESHLYELLKRRTDFQEPWHAKFSDN